MENKILSQQDLYDVLPFGKTKVLQLIKSGELPLVKVGKDYITTFNLLEEWIKNHIGEEIYYWLIEVSPHTRDFSHELGDTI